MAKDTIVTSGVLDSDSCCAELELSVSCSAPVVKFVFEFVELLSVAVSVAVAAGSSFTFLWLRVSTILIGYICALRFTDVCYLLSWCPGILCLYCDVLYRTIVSCCILFYRYLVLYCPVGLHRFVPSIKPTVLLMFMPFWVLTNRTALSTRASCLRQRHVFQLLL